MVNLNHDRLVGCGIGMVLGVALLCAGITMIAKNTVHVDAYFRSDGVFVRDHYRSKANALLWDNWGEMANTITRLVRGE